MCKGRAFFSSIVQFSQWKCFCSESWRLLLCDTRILSEDGWAGSTDQTSGFLLWYTGEYCQVFTHKRYNNYVQSVLVPISRIRAREKKTKWQRIYLHNQVRCFYVEKYFLNLYCCRRVPFITCKFDLNELLHSFLTELSLHNPALAIIHIPTLFAQHCYTMDLINIANIFPATTVVVKLMENIFSLTDNKIGIIELQALLISSHMR